MGLGWVFKLFLLFKIFLKIRPSFAQGLLQAQKSRHMSEFPVCISVLHSPCYEYFITFIHLHWEKTPTAAKQYELKWKSLPAFIERGDPKLCHPPPH